MDRAKIQLGCLRQREPFGPRTSRGIYAMPKLVKLLKDGGLLESYEQIAVCVGADRETTWLELQNLRSNLDGGNNDELVITRVGAMKSGSEWLAIEAPGPAKERIFIEPQLSSSEKNQFQKAIIQFWEGYNPKKPADWAKSNTVGKSLTSASFIAKALKVGYDAIGVKMKPAFSGLKLTDWTVKNLLEYVNRVSPQKSPIAIPYPPIERYAAQETKGNMNDGTKLIQPLLSSRKQKGPFAYDDFFKKNPAYSQGGGGDEVPRIIAYAFRGDARTPEQMRDAGGFWPNATRQDQAKQISQKLSGGKGKTEEEWSKDALNLKGHIGDPFLKGYVSTSKSIKVAKGFAQDCAGSSPVSYVYVLFVEGGFNIPKKGVPWEMFSEHEIAFPGGFDWDDVVAYRKIDVAAQKFTGDIFLRPGALKDEPAELKKEIMALLSGKPQK